MVGGSLWVLQLLPSLKQTGRHDIAEILLKVALKHPQKNQISPLTVRMKYKNK
jgi:hypothetical protein